MRTSSQEQISFVTQLGAEFERVARQSAPRRRTLHMRTRTVVLAALASLVVAAGAGAATGIVPLPGGGPAFTPRDATGEFSTGLTEHLSVLGRPRTTADAMGSAAAYVSGPDGAAPGSSLRVAVPPPGAGTAHASAVTLPVWLLPTAMGDVTMQVLPPGADGPASGFAADEQMVEQGHARMSVGDDTIGLAPDGVAGVDLTLEDGAHVKLPVVQNVFGAHLDEPVKDVAFITN